MKHDKRLRAFQYNVNKIVFFAHIIEVYNFPKIVSLYIETLCS